MPLAILLDIPQIDDTASDAAGYVAAAQSPWPGTVAVWRSPEQSGFALKSLVPAPAVTGITITELAAGPVWRIDRTTRLLVEIDGGILSSITPLQLFGAANLAAIEHAPDTWELLQFQTATLIAPGRYELTALLRGQRGTEAVAASLAAPGARFVLLDGAIQPVTMTAGDIMVPYNYKVGPASRDIGDPSYRSLAHTFRGVGLVPLAPVHVRANRSTAGDLTITWFRRTRKDGANWEPSDVALGEEAESYTVEILSDASATASVVRRMIVGSTAAVYPATQQLADFGAIGAPVTVRIAQMSRAVGAGTPATVTL
jgi:hypothetical protein